MQIPPELEQELKEFAFIIDNNKKIKDVYLSEGMATILESYSKRVQEGNAGITDTDLEGNLVFKYCYLENNSELYEITTDNPDDDKAYDYTYFENELAFRVSGINDYGANPIIMYIQSLLRDQNYNIFDQDEPDITDLLENFDYFRAVLHKRLIEFTRTPIEENRHDQNIEGTARLFITERKELWKNDKSLLPVHKYDYQHESLEKAQNIYYNTYETESGCEISTFLVLFEDRIIRLNYANNFIDLEIEHPRQIPDAQTYLFADNQEIKEFNVPASPEGFLLLKMMEI